MSFPPFNDFSQLFYGFPAPPSRTPPPATTNKAGGGVPRIRFGLSEGQTLDLRRWSAGLIQTIEKGKDIKAYFERLWVYWCNEYGVPRIGPEEEEDSQNLYYIRRARFWSVLNFYCRIPEGIAGTIVKKRLNAISVTLGQLKWEKDRQRGLRSYLPFNTRRR